MKKKSNANEKQVLRICFRFRLENAYLMPAWCCRLALTPIHFALQFLIYQHNAFSHIYADDLLTAFFKTSFFTLHNIVTLSFGVN